MHVTELNIYPVKSLAGISLKSSEIDAGGLCFDRRWMIVDADYQMMTQRSHPQMALIKTALEKETLILSAAGLDDLPITSAHCTDTVIETKVHSSSVRGFLYDPHTAHWLSQALGIPCHLLTFDNDFRRNINKANPITESHVYFADAYPILVVSQASLDQLNQHTPIPVSMQRFRPNIVVNGVSAHDEDSWSQIRINDVTLHLPKLCDRCIVITVDPNTGTRTTNEPLKTLAKYRRHDNKVYFGNNAVVATHGTIHIGDTIDVIDTQTIPEFENRLPA